MSVAKAYRLKNVVVDRVDLVDVGANLDKRTADGAHIMLYKRAADQAAPIIKSDAKAVVDRLVKAIKAAPGVSAALIAKADQMALTFDQVLAAQEAREALDELWDLYYAFMQAAQSIFQSDEADKMGLLRGAAADFIGAFLTSMPDAIAGIDEGDAEKVAKAGRKISAARMKQLKSMHESLGKILAECEGDATMKIADYAKSLGLTVADTATDGDIQKAISDHFAKAAKPAGLADDVQKALDTQKAEFDAELAKRDTEIVKANAAAASERDQRITKEFDAICKSDFSGLGLTLVLAKGAAADAKTDAQIFKALAEKAPEEWKRVAEILKSAAAAISESDLFKEAGRDGEGAATGSALEQIEALAQELVTKGAVKSLAEAVAKVAQDPKHAELYARHVEEQRAASKH